MRPGCAPSRLLPALGLHQQIQFAHSFDATNIPIRAGKPLDTVVKQVAATKGVDHYLYVCPSPRV